MSAEDMRIELETFVNQGLEEGWGGWPTKGQLPDRQNSGSARQTAFAGIGHSVVPMDWWFPELGAVSGPQAVSGAGKLSYSDFPTARRFGGNGPLWRDFG